MLRKLLVLSAVCLFAVSAIGCEKSITKVDPTGKTPDTEVQKPGDPGAENTDGPKGAKKIIK